MITKKQMSEQQALSRLASACSQAEHCTGEINQKLEQWGIAPDAHQRILDYLITNKYVDDARFAKLFVRDKLKFNKWGRRKIAEALWMKRIPTDIQEEALAEITDEDYTEILIPLLKAKAPSIKANSNYEWSMKLIKFAMSRGFDMSIIKHCIDDIGIGFEGDGDDDDYDNDFDEEEY